MSFGIFVRNQFDDICIDERWVNYSLLVESSIQCQGGQWNPGQGGDPTFPVTMIPIQTITSPEPPILFGKHRGFLVDGNGHYLAECKPVGYPGNWTGFAVRCGGSGVRALEYRIYGILPRSSSYGMVVRRADGAICFDSGRRPLIVERIIQPSEWVLTYNDQAGQGFREQDWSIDRPLQEYISMSTPMFFDGIQGMPSGRVITQIAADYSAPATKIRHAVLYDSGTNTINPGPGSRTYITPMLCDAQ